VWDRLQRLLVTLAVTYAMMFSPFQLLMFRRSHLLPLPLPPNEVPYPGLRKDSNSLITIDYTFPATDTLEARMTSN
jgi:hypothetical protein